MIDLLAYKGRRVQKDLYINNSYKSQPSFRARVEGDSDLLELSSKNDKKETPWGKIAAGAVVAAGIIFAAVKLRKNPSKASDIVKDTEQEGEKAVNKAKEKIGNAVDNLTGSSSSKTERTASSSSSKAVDEADDLRKETETAASETYRPKSPAQIAAEKHKVLLEDFNKNLRERYIYEPIDDEVLDILMRKYKGETDPAFKMNLDTISNRTLVSDEIMNAAKSAKKPEDKERLLIKSYNFLPHAEKSDSYYKKYVEHNSVQKIFEELSGLYETGKGEFKFKSVFEKTIQPKFLQGFKNTTQCKNLKEIMGSDVDYNLYNTLEEKGKNYKDIFGNNTNPLGSLVFEVMSADDKKQIVFFLEEALPNLIREEKNIFRKEDLLRKHLNITRQYTNQTYTERSFAILDALDDIYRKNPEQKVVHHYEHVYEMQSDLDKTLDEFIFKKFNIPELADDAEKMELAREVINRLNVRFFFFTPKDVTYKHILRGLENIAKKNNSEKHYLAAINVAKSQNAREDAIQLIERIEKNENISQTFKDSMTKLKIEFKQQVAQLSKELEQKLTSKSLNEAFKNLSARVVVQDSIDKVAVKLKKSKPEILKAMQDGDGRVIRRVISESINASNAENLSYEGKTAAIWDDIISYLGKIDEAVKDPVEVEMLKNYRLRALGAKVMELKKTNPELQGVYHNMLIADLKDIMFGKGGKGLSAEMIDPNSMETVARQIEDIVWTFEPEMLLYSTLKGGIEEHKYSNEAAKVLKVKLKGIKDRLGIRSEEDFFNDFKNRFYGGADATKSSLTKESAIDVFNKLLDENYKLTSESSVDDIKKAFRFLSHKYHPDTAQGDKKAAEDIFKQLGDAYSVLNPKKKA